FNSIIDEKKDPTKIGVGVFIVKAGQRQDVSTKSREVALIAFRGEGLFHYDGQVLEFNRLDWETQGPAIIHVPRQTPLSIEAREDSEIILCAIENPDPFEIRAYAPDQVRSELRAAGTLNETATRIVRTAFDKTNAPPASRMVLGEVVNFPGKWSSYPPHFHPQPEVYFYRFKKE